MKKTKQNIKLWDYLDSIGVLVNGTPDQIKSAKKEYSKQYQRNYKKEKRLNAPEFTISFAKQSPEYIKVARASKSHKMAISHFIKLATLAYLDKTFIVPNLEVIYNIEQLLAGCLNEIQTITRQKEKHHWEREAKYQAIEAKIALLETELRKMIYTPPTIEDYIYKAIEKDNSLKDRLQTIINAD